MCLAVPARIISLDSAANMAVVDLDGIRKETSTMLLDSVKVGDYVLLHVGFALEVINPDEAERTLAIFAEMRADAP
ncbi:MAG: HypC/HybG/HupF family hydrogenase formation chaperone [Zetaproteobacteria bacterium CG06_land_8_20_14_3_00_59_53]|nr:MAG: hydrogenase assembly protein HupF [Zetaproteobacteria bacterium CG2_30_59_37]PIO90565.1 MAG: HypC/HybG/HupF family hydrogenase formation chaperone [Zetaproteobacteria bacterium CG23_combo_of_CG06-09_8_20_14_all_59_86]PIQ66167.1 MAG: HypC/HybG/HupF family hydrogenase formation chaperone [Zetaproteobacteria bacterium CG11_big_fil_rev_8_21_14_0_20_59_439]PIU71513.1 MAG: HypC/HybG/HupF family hydrogenase formation chaperone [Zetaproteobacteria bacterium CG06_land_8_20_14_3_00_59_53]PIU97772